MDTVQEIISFFGLPVTAYALCLTAALCAALALLAAQCRRLSLRPGTALTMALWMLPLGLAGARLFYCLARLSFFMEVGLGSMLKMWNGGFALWGALGGAVLGAVIAARQTHQRPALLLDALAAPGALAIALCRLAEYFSGEGIGMYVEDERFCFFPLAVCNQYEEWYWAIFLLEALVALVILGVLLRRARPAGDTARLFLILYSASQVLLESMRRDNFLRWLFVRVSQLTAALVMAGLMLYALIHLARAGRLHGAALRGTIASWAVFLACTGIIIALEFAIDKSADLPIWAAYCLMAFCCVGLGVACYQAVLGQRCRIAEDAGKPAS